MALPAHVRRQPSEPIPPPVALMTERHFTVGELAALWGFSVDYINGKFRDEPGVLTTQKRGKTGRRTYGVIRVPQSVAERVYSGMMNK